jgi:hypothetical protein
MIFDVDGTVADTLALCLAAYRHAFALHGHPDLDDAQVTALFGPNDEGIIRSVVGGGWQACYEHFYAYYTSEHDAHAASGSSRAARRAGAPVGTLTVLSGKATRRHVTRSSGSASSSSSTTSSAAHRRVRSRMTDWRRWRRPRRSRARRSGTSPTSPGTWSPLAKQKSSPLAPRGLRDPRRRRSAPLGPRLSHCSRTTFFSSPLSHHICTASRCTRVRTAKHTPASRSPASAGSSASGSTPT